MTSSSPAPKLPLWIFFLTDAVLVSAAGFIAYGSARPLSQTAILSIVACVVVGTLTLAVPLVAYYERQKNETLDDRQRALESLARTVASSAEQISIAANGLHEIAELAQRNMKHAEQLPHKLQDKIAEFQAQLANANDTEKEELEKQLEELRSTETERLQTLSDRLTRVAGEFAKLETTTHQHLVAANDAVSKLSFGTASAIGKAQAAAEQALAQARQEAAKAVGEATGTAIQSIEAAKSAATKGIAEQFDQQIARLHEATEKVTTAFAALQQTAPSPASAPAEPITEPVASSVPEASEPAAKRPRKSRRHEAVDGEAPMNSESVPARPIETVEAVTSPSIEPTATAADPSATPEPAVIAAAEAAVEPSPVTPEKMVEVAPIAPNTAQPFDGVGTNGNHAESSVSESEPTETTPKLARKRSPKPAAPDEPGLGLELDEPTAEPSRTFERVLSSDGATRLIVTAYIGIGNRLFIRGSGPGLSWEKGVPLQFVSIGKWRWETNDASAPIQFKLFKNDEQETHGVGELTIEPGHQHELTANFG